VLALHGCAAPPEPADELGARTTRLDDGTTVTTTIGGDGVRFSVVRDRRGDERWLRSDGLTLTAFDGETLHTRDLRAVGELELQALASHLARRSAIASEPVFSVHRDEARPGSAALRLDRGDGRWARLDLQAGTVEIFDGHAVQRLALPRVPLVPADLDRYNRWVVRDLERLRAQARAHARPGQLVAEPGIAYANGCGSEGGLPVPDGNWVGACNAHDDCYDGLPGYAGYSRLDCDNQLFIDMVGTGPAGALLAPLYWLVVRLFGDSNYNYNFRAPGSNENDSCYQFTCCFNSEVDDEDDGWGEGEGDGDWGGGGDDGDWGGGGDGDGDGDGGGGGGGDDDEMDQTEP
jgi:hypothetical protein